MTKRFFSVFLLFLFSLITAPGVGNSLAAGRIKVASTTSTQNSGFFDYALPIFQKKTGIHVDVVAVGTGAAIEIGKRGDADAVFVHAKKLELKALKEGFFVDRHDVMYNDFIIVGPPGDPAHVSQVKKAADAFKRIASTGSLFVSRADHSGTNIKEMEIWESAGIKPRGSKWYLEAGQGMSATLRIAKEKNAYCLTDRGTFLTMVDELGLKILFQGEPSLFNQYGVMIVNPQKYKNVNYEGARAFVDWLISDEGQRAIASYKDKHGNQLFFPDAK
jgi:tungstate transport system substrate-binding protein